MILFYIVGLVLFVFSVREHDMAGAIAGLTMNCFGLLYLLQRDEKK